MAQYRILEKAVTAASQLENEIVNACREGIKVGLEKLRKVRTKEEWEALRPEFEDVFQRSFPEMLKHRAKMEPKLVSRFEFEEFDVENVLFCSLPGWEVNASVYFPKGEGKYPAVVCPTGHSTKFKENYYGSAQMFARNGYIAISIDPPGCAGELWQLNDHFYNGVLEWLVGIWCQTHFVADALACIDYLETREDVDASKGFAMTGVSGGGLTTVFCAAYDDRITFAAPVCCIADQEALHFTGLYTSCPEQHGWHYHDAGMDVPQLLSLSAPKRMLIVGGKLDEVFDYKVAERVYKDVKRIYGLYGCEENVELFLQEDSGHAYTVVMANRVIDSMNKFFKDGQPPRPLSRKDVIHLKQEELSCYPSGTVNMFTVTRDKALEYKMTRPKLSKDALANVIKDVLLLEGVDFEYQSVEEVPEAELPHRWNHLYQNVVIHHHDGKVLPGIFGYRMDKKKRPAVLYIDEQGKWNGFNHGGVLCQIMNFISGAEDVSDWERSVFSVDVSGMGELEMQHTTFDSAGWNDIERIISYLSFAHGRPVVAYQVRDALIALNYIKNRANVDEEHIILAGHGAGAVIALLAGYLAGDAVEKVIAVEPLAAYQCLTESFPNNWGPMPIIPDILSHFDLPDMVENLGEKAICIRPLDEMRRPLVDSRMLIYYADAIKAGAKVYANGNADQLFAKVCKRR